MPNKTHAFITRYMGLGINISSPQVPALVAGEYGEPDSRAALVELLESAGADPGSEVTIHRQEFNTQEGREWVVRISEERMDERVPTLRALQTLLQVTPLLVEMNPSCPTGEVLFVVVLPDDRVGWLADQMWPGDILTMVLDEGDGLVTMPLLNDDAASGGPVQHVDRELTVADVRRMTGVEIVNAPREQFLSRDPVRHISSATMASSASR